MTNLSRRTFVLGGLATAGATALPMRALAGTRAAQAATTLIAYPFTLGVTSGDPAPDSVVLWTRLAPSPTNADGQGGMPNADVTVEWQVSLTSRRPRVGPARRRVHRRQRRQRFRPGDAGPGRDQL